MLPLKKAARGRPRIGRTVRVPFPGATTTPDTRDLCASWQVALDVSRGLLLDQIFAFALVRGFVRPAKTNRRRPLPGEELRR